MAEPIFFSRKIYRNKISKPISAVQPIHFYSLEINQFLILSAICKDYLIHVDKQPAPPALLVRSHFMTAKYFQDGKKSNFKSETSNSFSILAAHKHLSLNFGHDICGSKGEINYCCQVHIKEMRGENIQDLSMISVHFWFSTSI